MNSHDNVGWMIQENNFEITHSQDNTGIPGIIKSKSIFFFFVEIFEERIFSNDNDDYVFCDSVTQ